MSKMSHLMAEAGRLNEGALDKITEAQRTLPESPVDICGLCERIGVPTEKREGMLPNISGFILREPGDKFKIFYNGDHPKTRQHFTVAHELAHYLLHRSKLGDKYPENVLLRGGLPNDLEMEANQLGAEILMPSEAIDNYTAASTTISIPDMAKIFGVSPEGVSIRLGIPLDV